MDEIGELREAVNNATMRIEKLEGVNGVEGLRALYRDDIDKRLNDQMRRQRELETRYSLADRAHGPLEGKAVNLESAEGWGKLCVRVEHLEVVSRLENVKRQMRAASPT